MQVERQARTVYISLWLPLASETFVYYEAEGLYDRGFPVSGFALYGEDRAGLGARLLGGRLPVERLGLAAIPRLAAALLRGLYRQPGQSAAILKDLFCRRWRGIEMWGENIWAGICGFYLAERCRALEVEHVHAAWACGPGTAAWVIHRLTDIPFSITALARDIRPPDGALAAKLKAAAFVRVDASHNLPYLAAFDPEGAALGKHHLVYNVRTLSAPRTAKMPMRLPLRLLCLGRMIETKGFQYAIEAVSLLKKRGLTCELTIAGDGAFEKKLKNLARQLGLEDEVHFPGFVHHDDVPELMLASDIFLMPSCISKDTGGGDGLPTVIMEAMSNGLPVISTNVMGISDVVRHGKTGLLLPERDAASLADAIERLYKNRDDALLMAAKARELVMDMFDPDKNLQRLAELYNLHASKLTEKT